jgi:type II secretory pathway pseudopilin PulG
VSAPAVAAPAAPPARGRRRRRAAISAEQLASRQLQGRYLALIRQIPATRRGLYAKIAKEKGREAAIAQMKDVVKK